MNKANEEEIIAFGYMVGLDTVLKEDRDVSRMRLTVCVFNY